MQVQPTIGADALKAISERFAAEERERPAIRAAGIAALHRLLPVAQRCSGQSRIVRRFLLSLYNGQVFPFALTDLRGLDTAPLQRLYRSAAHGSAPRNGGARVHR
ncbi:DUF7673 family protein [Pseudomonas sp. S11A4]|uniref:DUF7673 family protein n=1 Tax=Pseudomonas sp. S11A4 TaxID=1476791 RepID=UPI003158B80C